MEDSIGSCDVEAVASVRRLSAREHSCATAGERAIV